MEKQKEFKYKDENERWFKKTMKTQTKQQLKRAFLNSDFYIILVGMVVFIMITTFNCPSAQYHKMTWVLISAFMNMWLIKNWTDGLKQ